MPLLQHCDIGWRPSFEDGIHIVTAVSVSPVGQHDLDLFSEDYCRLGELMPHMIKNGKRLGVISLLGSNAAIFQDLSKVSIGDAEPIIGSSGAC